MAPANPGPVVAQSMARLPPLRSQPACRQDRVVVSGAEAVLGRQAGERHSSIEERELQIEAPLEEKSKELPWVPVGRRPGWVGPVLPFSAAPVSAVECVCVALSADPGTQPREQGQMWSPVGGGQGPVGPHVQEGHLLL